MADAKPIEIVSNSGQAHLLRLQAGILEPMPSKKALRHNVPRNGNTPRSPGRRLPNVNQGYLLHLVPHDDASLQANCSKACLSAFTCRAFKNFPLQSGLQAFTMSDQYYKPHSALTCHAFKNFP
eukprot:1149435-Pelagomonas_calceolata.AAC.5